MLSLVRKPAYLTEIATAVGSIKLGGAALAEKLPVSRFAACHGGGGNRFSAPVAVAGVHPSG